jgi:hypothetical protein
MKVEMIYAFIKDKKYKCYRHFNDAYLVQRAGGEEMTRERWTETGRERERARARARASCITNVRILVEHSRARAPERESVNKPSVPCRHSEGLERDSNSMSDSISTMPMRKHLHPPARAASIPFLLRFFLKNLKL